MSQIRKLALMGLIAAFTVAGCGGSSSTTPPISIAPPPPAPAPTVNLKGAVTDMPIANATVVITVDGEQFTATNPTDANGNFEVEISSDNPDALVLCEAFVPGGPIAFTALLNNFAGLQAQADSSDEVEGVDITNVTTAQFLLASELATDGSIDDLAELQELSAQVDGEQLLQISAAIKIVVDSVQGATLPVDFDDVQELAQAIIDGTTTFLDDIELLNPGILDEVIQDVIEDGNATDAFVEAEVPGVYVDAEERVTVAFFADGSGHFGETDYFEDEFGNEYDNQSVAAIEWLVNEDGVLEVTFVEAQETVSLSLVNDAGGLLTVFVSGGSDDSGQPEEPSVALLFFQAFDSTGWVAADVPGSYQGTDPDEGEEMEYTVLLADGSGYDIDIATGVQDDYLTWSVDEDARLLITDDESGAGSLDEPLVSTIYKLAGSSDSEIGIFEVEATADGELVLEIEVGEITYTDEIFTGPMPDVANTALLEGKTYVDLGSDGNIGILTFGENGEFHDIYQDFEDDVIDFGEETNAWFIDEDAVLYLTFEADDGSVETDTVQVVSGLGEASMTVEVNEDGQTQQITVSLVTAFEASEVEGTWMLEIDGQVINEGATFNSDGSGNFIFDGQNDGNFNWSIDASGQLSLTDDAGAEVYTDVLYKLSSSTTTVIDGIIVYYADGELISDLEDTERGEIMEVIRLVKEQS